MFKNPSKSARPMVRWWWPGMDVEEGELLREIAELDEKGFYGAEIQVFWLGLPMKMKTEDPERFTRCHRYLQPYYYETVKSVLDECEKRGMIIDLTVCSAWPVGGVHVQSADSMQTMFFGTALVGGGRNISCEVPEIKKPFFYEYEKEFFPKLFGLDESTLEFLPDEMKLFRLLAAKAAQNKNACPQEAGESVLLDIGSVTDLTDKVRNGRIEWDAPEGDWRLFSFFYGPSGTGPLGDAKECADGKSIVINHLSSASISRYLEYHFGRGKSYFGRHFGKTFRAFFTDSLELVNECFWTQDFLEKFRQLRGYDLAPYLPVIHVPDKDNSYTTNKPGPGKPRFDFADGLGSRIRHDVQMTISDLFADEFVRTMTEWAEAHGLKSRIQSYGIRADTLKAWGISHIPETETLYAGGVIDFLRMAGSAGIIYGRPIVTAEAMSWNNRDFMTTPLKIKVTADRLFVSGINQMIFHGFPYQGGRFSYPGYRPFSNINLDKSLNFSSCFSWSNPHWEHIRMLNEYITRCQYILQQGETVCNVGIFYSKFNYGDLTPKYEEMVRGVLGEDDAPLPEGVPLFDEADGREKLDAESLEYLKKQVAIGDSLMENGYYYVHVNEDRLLNCEIRNCRAVIGSAKLEVLVIPYVEAISLPLVRRLKEMQEMGVRVLFVGTMPLKQPGFLNYERNDAEIFNILHTLDKSENCFISDGKDVARHIRFGLAVSPGLFFEEETEHVQYIQKRAVEKDYFFIRHNQNSPCRISIRFPFGERDKKVPFILDPWTGNACEAAQYKTFRDSTELVIYFEAYSSVLIEFRPAVPSVHLTCGSVRAVREGNSLFSCFEKAGKCSLDFYPSGKQEISIEREPPEKKELGPWRLRSEFRDAFGSIREINVELAELKDWREIPELKYNSGRGVYSAEFMLENDYFDSGLKLFLELGRVYDVAVVKINGSKLEPLLVYPYSADITSLAVPGMNEIEVEVVTTLRNRLVGYGETGNPEYANYKGRELAPAGLIGPVHIVPKWKINICEQQ